MLAYHNAQCNTKSHFFGSSTQKSPKTIDYKVIFKTKEQLQEITDFGFKWLQNETTQRPTSSGVIFSLLGFRHLELGECITKIVTMTWEIKEFGYDKTLCARQIKRIIKRLKEIGLITYERCNKKNMRSPYRYKVTKFGKDIYYYFYKQNKTHIQYSTLELPTDSVDIFLPDSKCHLANAQNDPEIVQMSPRDFSETPMNTGPLDQQENLNVTSIRYGRYKKDLNIHTRAREEDKREDFFVSDPYPEPDEEEIEMFVDYPKHNFTQEQEKIIQETLALEETNQGDEQIFKDEIAAALENHWRRGIQIVNFRYFIEKVKLLTWEKYYWDMRPKAEGRH